MGHINDTYYIIIRTIDNSKHCLLTCLSSKNSFYKYITFIQYSKHSCPSY